MITKSTASIDLFITCDGEPVIGFPVDLIDHRLVSQIVFVPYITYKRTRYMSGAYVLLKRKPQSADQKTTGWMEIQIVNVKLQADLLLQPLPQMAPAATSVEPTDPICNDCGAVSCDCEELMSKWTNF